MNKILVICGPTATGKTSLGIALAKEFDGEIISADSRQVYKDMDIGTGKEWDKEVKIWGYDLVSPLNEFSVSHFLDFAKEKIDDIKARNKLPIIVGGTGFYIKGIVDGIGTIDVPQNKSLRKILEVKSADDLFEMLSGIDPIKSANMNFSDKNNPRRLVRAIEVAQFLIDHPNFNKELINNDEFVQIGLTSSIENIKKRIAKRVLDRVEMGMKDEVKKLLEGGVDWSMQSMYSLGYRQYRDFFEGGVPEDVVISEWTREEIKYAKRQITWFKKDKRITWFDANGVNKTKSDIIALCREKLKFRIKQ
jgi:tRNA dimethylallyltransferase